MMFLVDNYEMKYWMFDEEDFEFCCELDENHNEIYIDDLDELEEKIYKDDCYDQYELFDDIEDIKGNYKYGGDLMKKLIVPKDLYGWLGNYTDMIGDDSVYFEIINDLMNDYHGCVFDDETRRFIHYYMMEISEVISGKREYRVEEDEFYALIIGHEIMKETPMWAYSERKKRLSISYYTGYQGEIYKMTKDEWEKLGVNESNAIFTQELK